MQTISDNVVSGLLAVVLDTFSGPSYRARSIIAGRPLITS
jgi:hypothetical protein